MTETQEKARLVVKNIHTAWNSAKEETIKLHNQIMPRAKPPKARRNIKYGGK